MRHGSSHFYTLLNNIREYAESDFNVVRKMVRNTARHDKCSDYDAAAEIITVYMLLLKDALQNLKAMTRIETICRMIAETAIMAILCSKNNGTMPGSDTTMSAVYAWLHAIEALHYKKNHDYAYEHPLMNFMTCAVIFDLSLPQTGLFYLMTKKERLRTIRQRKTQLVDENIDETLKDMVVYALLTAVMAETERTGWDKDLAREVAWKFCEGET